MAKRLLLCRAPPRARAITSECSTNWSKQSLSLEAGRPGFFDQSALLLSRDRATDQHWDALALIVPSPALLGSRPTRHPGSKRVRDERTRAAPQTAQW